MVSIIVLGLTLFVGALTAAPSPGAYRVVGGTETSISEYPSIVQLEFHVANHYWDQSCGATIITPNAVLSAAHCTHPTFDWFFSPQTRRIRAGADKRNTGGVLANVATVLNHPDFDLITFENNICIIKLEAELTFGDNIQAISILTQDYVIPDNSAVIVAGWGQTSNEGTSSDVLQHATTYIVNNTICYERYYSSRITERMICAGILDEGGKDACGGDYGGPLYYKGFLAGITSWGGPCADPFFPGISTRVASFTDWIVANA